MNYIVLDLEWNQSGMGKEKEADEPSFEIIEIGAVKLNQDLAKVSEFNEVIKPQIYHEMHPITGKMLHVRMEELEQGGIFTLVMHKFLAWCGQEEYRFCTWGMLDLTELQKNMKYYGMEPLANGPIPFYDVQKLFGIVFDDRKNRRSLEYAIDFLKIPKDVPFHRAFSDAYYTARVMALIYDDSLFQYISFDVYHPPKSRDEEIKKQFDTYMKYISREFADKTGAFDDKEVVSSKCYLCRRNLRKKVKWFTINGKNYYCVAYCEKHGYLKGKIRIRKSDAGGYYIVKTTRFITKEEADLLAQRKLHSKELRKKRRVEKYKRCD